MLLKGLDRIRPSADMRAVLTNLLFESDIPRLREQIEILSQPFDSIAIFFDNLDKGWPIGGIEQFDLRTLRHLIETLERIRRDMSRKDVEIKHLVFIRSDVYELLVDQTSDRGKYNPIGVDWSDPEQLRRVITERVEVSVPAEKFENAMAAMNPQLCGGKDTLEVLMEASMMRPRFLIDLCENMLTFAINRKHSAVQQNDIESALNQHSLYLVSIFGLEVRDVSKLPSDFVRKFKRKIKFLTAEEVVGVLGIEDSNVIDVLLSSGFLGFIENEKPVYIYQLHYDMNELRSRRDALGDDVFYQVNPAFMGGLSS